MYSLKYHITTRSPVVISAISGDANMVATEKYIPGSTVLGLLAKRFIDNRCNGQPAHKNDEFYKWFLVGELKIGHAYIFSQDEYGDHSHFPTPLSIEKEKYETGVYDLLFCDQQEKDRTEQVGDFCYLRAGSLYKKTVETTINFHHKRNRTTGTSEKGKIFNYESIAIDQIFEGTIHGRREELQNLINICGNEWPAYIGRSKNAQYGAVRFEFIDKEPLPLPSQIIWPEIENEDGERYPAESISMTLLSDLILYNEWGFPTIDVEYLRKTLQQYLGEVQIDELQIEKAITRKSEVENFVSVWRLKKPSETCFSAGSTFLLKIAQEKVHVLTAIQETGLGERTHEGFGRCAFALQTQTHANLIMRDEAEAMQKPMKPEGDMPESARGIVKTIVKKIIREHISLDAINRQGSFNHNHLPSSSLIARLQAIARGAEIRRDFVLALNDLRYTAIKQLRQCVSRDYNLLEYLTAFCLGQSTIKGLEETGLGEEWITAMKRLDTDREFTLVENLINAIGKKPNDLKKFPKNFQKCMLEHVEFCYNPLDWKDFFRQPKNINLKNLCYEIDFKPEKEDGFTRKLNQHFYATFFAEMRKRKIAAEEGRNVWQ